MNSIALDIYLLPYEIMDLSTTKIRNIVIADDDLDDKIFFELAMNEIAPSLGLSIVSNGLQLLELLNSFVPDIVFLDLDMPYKNGMECLVEMRNHPVFENLPTVVYSSTTWFANIQTAYEKGAHLFFVKPFILRDYATALETILKMNWERPDAVKEQHCVNGKYHAFECKITA